MPALGGRKEILYTLENRAARQYTVEAHGREPAKRRIKTQFSDSVRSGQVP